MVRSHMLASAQQGSCNGKRHQPCARFICPCKFTAHLHGGGKIAGQRYSRRYYSRQRGWISLGPNCQPWSLLHVPRQPSHRRGTWSKRLKPWCRLPDGAVRGSRGVWRHVNCAVVTRMDCIMFGFGVMLRLFPCLLTFLLIVGQNDI